MLSMQEHYLKLEKTFPLFFKEKPPEFKEGFCLVFGSDIEKEEEILEIVEGYRKLMWATSKNGRLITKEEIYLIRGESILFVRGSGNHHWPPRCEKRNDKIVIPIDFHKGWHMVNFNLWKRKDLRVYWRRLLADYDLHNFHAISELAQQTARDGG